jgi:DNA-binding GntR family transcriptional regulator
MPQGDLIFLHWVATVYAVVQRGVPTPPSRQIASFYREKILSGELPAGTQLPSIVALAAEWQVATNTAKKAVRILLAEGLVETVVGFGTFVAKR